MKYKKLGREKAKNLWSGDLFKLGGDMYMIETHRIYPDHPYEVEIYAVRENKKNAHTVKMVMDSSDKITTYRVKNPKKIKSRDW